MEVDIRAGKRGVSLQSEDNYSPDLAHDMCLRAVQLFKAAFGELDTLREDEHGGEERRP